MSASFRIVAVPSEQFAPLFDRSNDELRSMNVRRMIADEKPGFPCRVSLADAEVGETVLLVPFTHHDVPSPYRGSGPIFVRRDAKTATPAVNEIPAMLRGRMLSLRGYDTAAMLVIAKVVHGVELEKTMQDLLVDERVSYVHIHNAAPGCYSCLAVRA